MNEKVSYCIIVILFLSYSVAIFLWGRSFGVRSASRRTTVVGGEPGRSLERAAFNLERHVGELESEAKYCAERYGGSSSEIQRITEQLRKGTEKMRDIVRGLRVTSDN